MAMGIKRQSFVSGSRFHGGEIGEQVGPIKKSTLFPRYDFFTLRFKDGKNQMFLRNELTLIEQANNENIMQTNSALACDSRSDKSG